MPVHKQPAASQTILSHTEKESVLAAYAMSNASNIEILKQGQKSVSNDMNAGTAKKAFIEASGERFILKQFPWYCATPEFIEASITFQNKLKKLGLCVPEILSTKNDEKYVTIERNGINEHYFVQRLANGSSWDGSKKHFAGFVDFLRRFHDISRLVETRDLSLPKEDVFSIAETMLGFAEQEITDKNPNITSQETRALRKLFDSFQNMTLQLSRAAKEYKNHAIGTHGDFNPTNMLFDSNGQVCAVLDFDNACLDDPLHDLAQAILHTCGFEFVEGTSKFDKPPHTFDVNKINYMAANYTSSLHSDEKERILSNLPYAVGAITIEFCVLGLLTGSYELDKINDLEKLPQQALSDTVIAVNKLAQTQLIKKDRLIR